MPIDLDQFNRLKKRSEKVKADKDRAEGALEQLLKKLAEDFECSTIDEARELLVELKKKERLAEERYQEELAKWEKEWGDKL